MEYLRNTDLPAHNVDILMIGRYLQPRPGSLPVLRYAHPEQFDALAEQANLMGSRAPLAGRSCASAITRTGKPSRPASELVLLT